METSFDLILKDGIAVTPGATARTDIGVRGGKIAAIGDLAGASAAEMYNAAGLHILPGAIDTQVHFREPGWEARETLESGSRAAVLGGITGVFEMPNTNPPTTSAEALNDKLARAAGRMHCNYAFYVGATAENAAKLGDLEKLPGVAGVKAFLGSSTGSLLLADEKDIDAALRSGTRRMAVHSEDEARLKARKSDYTIPDDPRSHPVWRDDEAARLSTERILRLARAARRKLHVLHVSTAVELPLLADARDFASVEVTPQHLTLSAPECYERLGTYAQMNPPVRGADVREALWRAVQNGLVDVIGSDHAPHLREDKAKAYPASPSGMPGVQTLMPLMLDHVHAGRLSLERLVDLTAAGPARLFGLCAKGRIALGYDADFTVVDLHHQARIENAAQASNCGWTPFDGMMVTGWPVSTIMGGKIVMRDGELTMPGQGLPFRFL